MSATPYQEGGPDYPETPTPQFLRGSMMKAAKLAAEFAGHELVRHGVLMSDEGFELVCKELLVGITHAVALTVTQVDKLTPEAHDWAKETAIKFLAWDPAKSGIREIQSGADLIYAERERQISDEGWTPEHDAAHENFELSQAAAAYLEHMYSRSWVIESFDDNRYQKEPPNKDIWPDDWDLRWFKPKSPMQDLIRAGALIAAEIDRLQRAGKEGK
ncbi:hypothetical protein JIN85_14775 [Luteolibacter pohnpeiensis]|uniref:Uncharacterized protein n=1 Tax=Luteolibacter pohnpeiensis TaxID=454153 RepID=A0A934S9F6_9BACT|nr:hypothetical protein [Luteolibacter pohnpeiensis]MBK1883679.1 hypothetical protein [Luteolibacter pohnpeiensis]